MIEDLPWHVMEKIYGYLDLQDLANLRETSPELEHGIMIYYTRMRKLKVSKSRLRKYEKYAEEVRMVLSKCQLLRVLKLPRCTFINNSLVVHVLSRNPHIEALDLTDCSGLGPAALQPIMGKLPLLKNLSLAHCTWVTPGILECIALKPRMFETLDLSHCIQLTDQALSMVFTACYHLREVTLSHIPSMTNKTLHSLVTHCPSLKKLRCRGCVNMATSAVKTEGEVELSPLRSLDDFLLESARFQVPNVKDMEKWGNRMVQNLLYYQTNYFLLGILIFVIVGIIHPVRMAIGVVTVGLGVYGFGYATNAQPQIATFKQSHPLICMAALLVSFYFLFKLLGSLLVFLLGILLPVAVVFVHASLRLRNIKNKIVNKMEMMGLKKTPMGVILETFGIEYTPFQ